jgi:uncharacterized protein YndB with AHSA1/START domain
MGARGVYREIAPPECLVHTETFDPPWYPGEALITSIFAEQGDRTILTATLLYASKGTRDLVLQSPMEEGVAQSYDRLAAVLAEDMGRTGSMAQHTERRP